MAPSSCSLTGRNPPRRVVAFTDDADVADRLARLADGGRIPSAEVMPGGPLEAMAHPRGRADAILVDLRGAGDALAAIASLAATSEAGLIAIGSDNDVSLYRRLRDAGVSDYLVAPLNEADLVSALDRLANGPTVRIDDGVSSGPKLTVVMGCRGGVGATGFAVSTAWWAAERLKCQTALVDLDLNFGSTALALDLMPGRGLREAIEQPERIDPLFVGSAMINATDNLFVLGAEEHPGLDTIPAPDGLGRLVDAVAESVPTVVVDLPRARLSQARDVLARADGIVLVTDLGLAGLRDTIRLRTLCAEEAPQAERTLVAMAPATGAPPLERKEFERAAEGAVDWVIPWTPKQAADGAAAGKPLASRLKARHPYVKAVADVAARAVTDPADATAEKGKRKWLW
jgi:pilus assembly protein CpaE